ncbi:MULTISPECIES: urease accessory protein UreF [unclassified Ensifer]|uniref:urease accessory protein UreF n=1 Tax=unclassified Ensifer TaxID=2633371 RepID=UPI000812C84D|nr:MULTISPECIES: urease accessory protein UreF [unclassified Ensifer]OCP02475.1 urease accessory protein UreF [Ensifer sp. LC14]OCP14222.1 urease accessory protein UreF [Ensifer sp. LC13]OCP14908.1 urease accessory protein UreF [Ensifer sp. LC11]OCP34385.1 urease accessory protein UreF [Ensifer sp. LC499]
MAEQVNTQALLRLVTWLSPAFPVGAFSYSSGLEQAVHDRVITEAEELRLWLETVIGHGSGWNDALLFAESYRAAGDSARLLLVAELAEALAGSRERHMETMLQGQAFLAAARSWPHPVLDAIGETAAYPVAVGAVAGAHETGLEPALAAYLNASVSNAVSVAIRCGVIGQRDGVGVIAALEPVIAATASKAAAATLDDLGSATIMADISALKHETLHSRLFRS